MAVYVDSAGFGVWDELDFQNPYYDEYTWQAIPFDPMWDESGKNFAIDLGQEIMDAATFLAVIYDVILP